jgi:tetratricopeptide (TPR) repeat protein
MAQITLRDYVQETEDAISAGRLDNALARCQQLLARFPDFLEAQRLIGEVYLAQGKMEEARQAFDWVLTNDPENALAYCDRALISERVSDFDTALDCYQQAYELSRGNSQIRSEFNRLSSRVGQQGFIFSRAGLARLYMRGDLLAQAIQEWEFVLASTPERLDARLGLLETYWRDGLYDRTEQLARQILNEVPGCLKARLLLAYVVSTRDMEQATTILQQARAWDPDLLMAQELFTEGTASEQFIRLVKQAPITFEADQSSAYQATLSTPPPPQGGNIIDLPTWSGFESWGELETTNNTSQEQKGNAELPVWSTANILGMDSPQPPQEMPVASSAAAEPSVSASEAWKELNQLSNAGISGTNTWGGEAETPQDDSFSSVSWLSPSSEDVTTPPAWLNMLTQQERQQLSGAIPPVPSPEEREVPSSRLPEAPAPPEQGRPQKKTIRQDAAPTPVSDDDEELPFGPEWLKSLGAATYNDQEEARVAENTYQDSHKDASSVAFAQEQAHPQGTLSSEHMAQGSSAAREEAVLTTLEKLEQDLMAQGFVSHQPHSLSSLSDAIDVEETPQSPENVTEQAMPSYDADLSSALAEFGNMQRQNGQAQVEPASSTDMSVEPPAQTAFAASTQEPEWLAPLRASTQDNQGVEMPEWTQSSQEVTVSRHFKDTQQPWVAQEPAAASSTAEMPAFKPTQPPADNNSSIASQAAAPARPDPLLEGELETTMRRPAVRLQHLQSQVMAQREAARRGKQAEKPSGAGAGDGTASYQDRLLRGYQYQLAGSYEEAMQEYRVIIKGAPELLGEVISNVRALLRLAPKYSAGYRVLGDAYMRQGEYLQAMEAYNKALTMAKKARS